MDLDAIKAAIAKYLDEKFGPAKPPAECAGMGWRREASGVRGSLRLSEVASPDKSLEITTWRGEFGLGNGNVSIHTSDRVGLGAYFDKRNPQQVREINLGGPEIIAREQALTGRLYQSGHHPGLRFKFDEKGQLQDVVWSLGQFRPEVPLKDDQARQAALALLKETLAKAQASPHYPALKACMDAETAAYAREQRSDFIFQNVGFLEQAVSGLPADLRTPAAQQR